MLELALCNELLHGEGMDLAEQARFAQALGYAGLELAPNTLGPAPHRMAPDEVAELRRVIEQAGSRVTGLHWLLSGYPEASITDPARQPETQDILIRLIDLCARLGGHVLVHGSPGQRLRPEGITTADLIDQLAAFFVPVAKAAEAAGVVYCIEPLSVTETVTITSVAEGAALVEAIGSPAFKTMIDCKAVGLDNPPVADEIREWVPKGVVGHFHFNDTNLGAPGMGEDPFPEIVQALLDVGWTGLSGVEPFRTCVDAKVTAAIGIATIRACERAAK